MYIRCLGQMLIESMNHLQWRNICSVHMLLPLGVLLSWSIWRNKSLSEQQSELNWIFISFLHSGFSGLQLFHEWNHAGLSWSFCPLLFLSPLFLPFLQLCIFLRLCRT